MKIHPKLDLYLTSIKTALDPISPPYWREYALTCFKEWRDAGSPLVEEPCPHAGKEPHLWDGHENCPNYATFATIPTYGEMHRRDQKMIESLRADLAAANQRAEDWKADSRRIWDLKNEYLKQRDAANARIKALEGTIEVLVATAPESHKRIHNAALEEAAAACAGESLPYYQSEILVAKIRGLKK